MPNTPGLSFQLQKKLNFSDGLANLELELQLKRGEWLGLLGPSGAGKTTVLRLLAGLDVADGGFIHVEQERWLDVARGYSLPTRRRRVGFVFQDHALFPHMTVRQNMRFARPAGSETGRADELLELVGLSGLATSYPVRLSGGQQQRLALARALASAPRLLLLDEPLSALDADLRREMQDLLLNIRARNLVDYAILVTHDVGEAERLVDRSFRLQRGQPSVVDCPPVFAENPSINPS